MVCFDRVYFYCDYMWSIFYRQNGKDEFYHIAFGLILGKINDSIFSQMRISIEIIA